MEKKVTKPHTKRRVRTVILSLCIAVMAWIIITATTNPSMDTTLPNLKVRFIGEQTLRDNKLAITGRDSIPAVSVTVRGSRSDLMKYMDDIFVEVDVSSVTGAGQYELTGNVSLPSTRLTVEKGGIGTIPITVEPLESKEVDIKIKQTGALRNKLVKSVVKDPKVNITGAKSEIDKVASAIATVDISKIKDMETTRVSYVLTDESGYLMTNIETLESHRAEVEVTNIAYNAKTLSIEPVLSPEMDRIYRLDTNKTTVSPPTVMVGVQDMNTEKVKLLIDKEAGESFETYRLLEEEGIYIPPTSQEIKAKPALESRDPANPAGGEIVDG